MKTGFNKDKYVELQSEKILDRIKKFDNKLYLEFGGKLFDDFHASRVLPGFEPDIKIKLLQKLNDKSEIIFVINAADIERRKIRADHGISYDLDVLRQIDSMRALGIYVNCIVITQYKGQPAADMFKKMLDRRGEKSYIHVPTKGYPSDIETIVSDDGYGANPYIETSRPLVVITAPGPGSGKLATCLSQLYHEYKKNVKAGYAKFETFPIWNLPLKHPVNIAYEAATADLRDVNLIDPYHLDAYGATTVNYNRDIEVFPIVKTILAKITGDSDLYKSPTDMGVNMAGFAISDDSVCTEASKQEVIRRYYKARCDYKQGLTDIETAQRIEVIMNEMGIRKEERLVVGPAIKKSIDAGKPAMAIMLDNGKIITGRRTDTLNAASSVILNAIKELSKLPDDIHLISPVVIEPMLKLKCGTLGNTSSVLNLKETLIALSICAATNTMAEKAMSKLKELKKAEAHSTCLLKSNDEAVLRSLGINLTSEPEFPTNDLYYN